MRLEFARNPGRVTEIGAAHPLPDEGPRSAASREDRLEPDA